MIHIFHLGQERIGREKKLWEFKQLESITTIQKAVGHMLFDAGHWWQDIAVLFVQHDCDLANLHFLRTGRFGNDPYRANRFVNTL